MSHPKEQATVQNVAEQLLGGLPPGSDASWEMPNMKPHDGKGKNPHPYGSHTNYATVAPDGSISSEIFRPG